MTLSDKIARQIMALLEASDGQTEIQRNNFAAMLGCVPSQINYVITSRFTPENGFVVYSRRGGGGYIQIKRIDASRNLMFMHIINSLGDTLDMASLRAILESMKHNDMLDAAQEALIMAAVDENALRPVPAQFRDMVRASIVKHMLLTLGRSKE